MRDIEYLIGNADIVNTPMQPYSEEAVGFVGGLSQRLMALSESKAYPDITALAFWARKGNLRRLAEKCPEAGQRLGRGLCFHIAPGNIPINFAFTYLFGVLSGCANIVRVPSRWFPQAQIVLGVIGEALDDFPEIRERTAFVRYSTDHDITAGFSRMADARMIWGGDRTIQTIKSMPASPRCVDIAFADRYSVCMMDGERLLEADERTVQRLCMDFYNDTYLMDQNACSSPQIILWSNDSEEARERFWNSVYQTAERRYELQAAVAVDKYTKGCEDAIDRGGHLGSLKRRENLLYRVEVSSLTEDMESCRGHGGYFYEYSLKNLDEWADIVTERYQTVTYFGIDPETLRRFVIDRRLRGIDRIVPVGKAMDVDIVWDGYDLVRMLSRIIV